MTSLAFDPPSLVVDVWVIDLTADWTRDWRVLDRDERGKIGRFRFASVRWRYAAAHVALRQVLARYLAITPAAVEFELTRFSKPQLVGRLRQIADLRFNLSHAGSRALVAVASGRDVGVDVEVIDPGLDAASLISMTCTPAEQRVIADAADVALFWRVWVRKEAALKAAGCGLLHPPDSVTVLPPVDFGWLVASGIVGRWVSRDLSIGAGYAACVAAEGDNWILAVRDFTDSKLIFRSCSPPLTCAGMG